MACRSGFGSCLCYSPVTGDRPENDGRGDEWARQVSGGAFWRATFETAHESWEYKVSNFPVDRWETWTRSFWLPPKTVNCTPQFIMDATPDIYTWGYPVWGQRDRVRLSADLTRYIRRFGDGAGIGASMGYASIGQTFPFYRLNDQVYCLVEVIATPKSPGHEWNTTGNPNVSDYGALAGRWRMTLGAYDPGTGIGIHGYTKDFYSNANTEDSGAYPTAHFHFQVATRFGMSVGVSRDWDSRTLEAADAWDQPPTPPLRWTIRVTYSATPLI